MRRRRTTLHESEAFRITTAGEVAVRTQRPPHTGFFVRVEMKQSGPRTFFNRGSPAISYLRRKICWRILTSDYERRIYKDYRRRKRMMPFAAVGLCSSYNELEVTESVAWPTVGGG